MIFREYRKIIMVPEMKPDWGAAREGGSFFFGDAAIAIVCLASYFSTLKLLDNPYFLEYPLASMDNR